MFVMEMARFRKTCLHCFGVILAMKQQPEQMLQEKGENKTGKQKNAGKAPRAQQFESFREQVRERCAEQCSCRRAHQIWQRSVQPFAQGKARRPRNRREADGGKRRNSIVYFRMTKRFHACRRASNPWRIQRP